MSLLLERRILRLPWGGHASRIVQEEIQRLLVYRRRFDILEPRNAVVLLSRQLPRGVLPDPVLFRVGRMRLGSEETEGMTHEMLSIGFLSIEGKGSGLTQVIGLGYI